MEDLLNTLVEQNNTLVTQVSGVMPVINAIAMCVRIIVQPKGTQQGQHAAATIMSAINSHCSARAAIQRRAGMTCDLLALSHLPLCLQAAIHAQQEPRVQWHQ